MYKARFDICVGPVFLQVFPTGLFLKKAYERHTVTFGLKAFCDDIRDIWRGGGQ